MAHIAVTDAAGGRHLFAERVSRAGVGWAGASQRDLRVWNEDWEVRLEYGRHRLQARDPRFAIDLLLSEDRPPVLHGERGFSQKGSSAGNATHYYSLTRMPTEGFVTLDGERFAVQGRQLDGPRVRHQLSREEPAGLGLVLDSAGRRRGPDDVPDAPSRRQPRPAEQRHARAAGPARSRRLVANDFSLTPGRLWSSPVSEARYPVEWRVSVPGEQLDLRVRPVVDAQELTGARSGVSYWEGAIDVEGTRAGQPLTGRGYLEMTGYSGRALGELLNPPPSAAPRKVP